MNLRSLAKKVCDFSVKFRNIVLVAVVKFLIPNHSIEGPNIAKDTSFISSPGEERIFKRDAVMFLGNRKAVDIFHYTHIFIPIQPKKRIKPIYVGRAIRKNMVREISKKCKKVQSKNNEWWKKAEKFSVIVNSARTEFFSEIPPFVKINMALRINKSSAIYLVETGKIRFKFDIGETMTNDL